MFLLVLIALTLTSLIHARPLSELGSHVDQNGPVDPQIVKWLQSQDPSLIAHLSNNGNVNEVTNSHGWKDLFKYMAQLNDYYVLFGRAR
ncbi:unnamed protein product [Hydatigera taeniaeformis]|uniref:Secreted protein n=1 Tax=Hydatigena taeniaeformis TaxID=6205 RepID=A0A0R3WNS1_HYDTA|nr:unnamed protein product [Hydatigera taeniaeformis]